MILGYQATPGKSAGDPATREGPARLHQLPSDARQPAVRDPLLCRAGIASAARDVVDLSKDRACLGRLYFKIPGGIAYGQHWLNVKFENSPDPASLSTCLRMKEFVTFTNSTDDAGTTALDLVTLLQGASAQK
ncbi:MAG TPA: hypothetical protein VFS23_19670 [Vicinamibacterales bacterium]|nr:hypothetical protein [Vicinamibacterales bacterium]